MRLPVLLLVAAAAWAQPALKPVALVNPPSDKPVISFQTMTDLEKQLDGKIQMDAPADPALLIGNARTLYLTGFGAIVTQEISVVATPVLSPFHQKITPQEISQTRQRKVAQLPAVRKTIREMWAMAAGALTSVPEDEQIVIAVRVLYQPWENTGGLPGQIVVKGSRKAGPEGLQSEEQ